MKKNGEISIIRKPESGIAMIRLVQYQYQANAVQDVLRRCAGFKQKQGATHGKP